MDFKHSELEKKPRIAIIGSGICGTTTAYYLSKKFENIDIQIFEKDQTVGGRTKSFEYKGLNLNLGAGFFIGANLNLISLLNEYKIEYNLANKDQQSRIAWDGNEIKYNSNARFSMLKMLYYHGYSLFKLNRFLSKKLGGFMKLYPKLDINDEKQSGFESAHQFLDFVQYNNELNKNGKQLCIEIGLREQFISQFLYGFVKGIYNNNINYINAFAMMITLQGMFQKAFTPRRGNDQLIKTMLLEKNDFCKVNLKSFVKEISYEKEKKCYRLQYVQSSDKILFEFFDVVIVATPLKFSNITFRNVDLPKNMNTNQQNKKVCVTLVEGVVNNEFFGLSKTEKLVESVILMEGSERKVGKINSFDQLAQTPNGKLIYRFESDEKLTKKIIGEMVNDANVLTEQVWDFAYPSLKPIKSNTIPPFRLARGLYFPSAMEFTSSCMEMQTLSAQNIVKLITADEGKNWKRKK